MMGWRGEGEGPEGAVEIVCSGEGVVAGTGMRAMRVLGPAGWLWSFRERWAKEWVRWGNALIVVGEPRRLPLGWDTCDDLGHAP